MECKVNNTCKYGFDIPCWKCTHYLLSVINSQQKYIKKLESENELLVDMHNKLYEEVKKTYGY